MPRKVWNFYMNDGPHAVELDYSLFNGKEAVYVDGLLQSEKRNLISLSSVHPITVGQSPGALYVRSNGFSHDFDVAADGVSVETGLPVVEPKRSPAWIWLFPLACLGIAIFAAGLSGERGISRAIGVLAVMTCVGFILDRTKPPEERIRNCALTAAACLGLALVWILWNRVLAP
jgi:hypothetical protein